MKVVHASALNVKVTPSWSLVSRTRTAGAVSATSTQFPPLAGVHPAGADRAAAGKLGKGTGTVDAKARLLAVEVLLAEPEELENDALEGDLYLRDKLILQDADGRRAWSASGFPVLALRAVLPAGLEL